MGHGSPDDIFAGPDEFACLARVSLTMSAVLYSVYLDGVLLWTLSFSRFQVCCSIAGNDASDHDVVESPWVLSIINIQDK